MTTELGSPRELKSRMSVKKKKTYGNANIIVKGTEEKSENDQEGKIPQDEQEFVDGGYGWVIVLSCFVYTMIGNGLTVSFGVLYADLVTQFNTSRTATMWLISIQTGIRSLSGVLVSCLINTYGARFVGVTGSLLVAFGTLICAHAPNIYVLYISYGFINGIGMNMLIQTGTVIPTHYFKQRRGLATGIISTGNGFGVLAFPLITSYLLDEFGIRGTFYLLAGVALQGVVFGFAIISPSEALRLKMSHKLLHDWHDLHNQMRKGFTMLYDIGSHFITTSSQMLGVQSEVFDHSSPARVESYPVQHKVGPLKTTRERDNNQGPKNFFENMKLVLRRAVDIKLLRNPVYLIFCMNSASLRFCTVAPIVLLPARTSVLGLTAENGALLVSIVGLSSIVGRIFYGLTADTSAVRPYCLYLYVSTFLGAGLVSIVNFGEEFYQQAIYASTFGFFFGAPFSLRYIVLADLIGVERIVTASGMLSLTDTVFIVLGPSVGAWLYEATGSYDVTYAVLGSSFIVGGAVLLLIPLVEKLRNRSSQDNEEHGNEATTVINGGGNANKSYFEDET